ncbi:uncharacterized protein LOC118197451 [Stegodyphus dumicola]|uniref:uncharacterized protein LOC118197451 n=1 Tax=Stegodyphus dumicola TaxID=202533 RepID=UPI0015AEC76C|nr:uncharacterized protein LOC118197451 [Stegodyphus dumicola]
MKEVKWWQGPPCLMLPDCLWPRSNLSEVNSEDLNTEKKSTVQFACNVASIQEPVLDIEKYSKLSRLYRLAAWIKLFIHNARKFGEKKEGPLAALELSEAEIYWVKTIQTKYFEEERNQLLNDQTIAKVSKLIEFDPKLDGNKLICIKGRLQFSKSEMKEKHPWLISGGNTYAEHLIMDAHNKVLRSGIELALAELRSKFWILRRRHNVKSVLNKCLICRRYKVRPGVQVIAPLPADRVQESPPFDVIVIDFAGPLFTRETKKSTVFYYVRVQCKI